MHFQPDPVNPMLHLQPYPPGLFQQDPPSAAQLCVPNSHSWMSIHSKPSPVNPFLHSQVAEPNEFVQIAYSEQGFSVAEEHSSISRKYGEIWFLQNDLGCNARMEGGGNWLKNNLRETLNLFL